MATVAPLAPTGRLVGLAPMNPPVSVPFQSQVETPMLPFHRARLNANLRSGNAVKRFLMSAAIASRPLMSGTPPCFTTPSGANAEAYFVGSCPLSPSVTVLMDAVIMSLSDGLGAAAGAVSVGAGGGVASAVAGGGGGGAVGACGAGVSSPQATRETIEANSA